MKKKSKKRGKNKRDKKHTVIQAAGGLLWRGDEGRVQIALIHRPRYNDWSFPKGSLAKGEDWSQAALREVYEETGCQARLGEFAGSNSYTISGQPKVVLYWHMRVRKDHGFTPNQEVDGLAWLSPQQALEKLDYPGERALLHAWLDHQAT